jgi:transposase
MFKKTTNQASFLEIEPYLETAIPKDDWCRLYQKSVLPLIDEEKFRHLYSASEGAPNASIRTMVSLLIFMGLEKYNWRQGENQFQRRLDWMMATHTTLADAHIDHTTLFKFFQRLERDDTAREVFNDLTEKFIEICQISTKIQRVDSFFIHGWLKTLTRYGLFKETLRKFLQSLRKQKPGLYEQVETKLAQKYLEDEFDLTEKDHAQAQKKVNLMAQDLYYLKSTFENHQQIQHYESFITLVKIFTQQCEVKPGAEKAPQIELKAKPDPDTICTPHNTDARYIKKGKQKVTGDKAFVTETCSPDNKTQFILDVEVVAATVHDTKEQPNIQNRLIEQEMKPEQQYADAGFVCGETILSSKKNGIQLEGPTLGHSQSPETFASETRTYDSADFEIVADENTSPLAVRQCPQQQAPVDQKLSQKTGEYMVHFAPPVCNACTEKNRCPVVIGKRVATLKISSGQYISAERYHQYMTDAGYRKSCAIRAGVEATVSELTRAHGVRKSRHRCRSRTRLQLIFAALACNVKRFIRHQETYAPERIKFA